MENNIEAPQKTKNRTAIWYRNSTPRNMPGGIKAPAIQVHCSIMETAKLPHYWWMDLENVEFVYNGILFIHKKVWNFVKFRMSKATYFLSSVEYWPKTKTAILWKQVILRGDYIWEGKFKRRMLRRWKLLMYSL
jgi:hypothetical protein